MSTGKQATKNADLLEKIPNSNHYSTVLEMKDWCVYSNIPQESPLHFLVKNRVLIG